MPYGKTQVSGQKLKKSAAVSRKWGDYPAHRGFIPTADRGAPMNATELRVAWAVLALSA
jgi:hypothetical protein